MKSRTISTLIFLLVGITNSNGQNFTPITVNDTQGVYNGEVIWFDFDNDSDLDFIMTGQSNTNDLHTRIYQNNGNNSFDLFTVLSGYSETGLQLMNVNGDQLIDLVINGRKIGSGNDSTSIYINNNTSFETENSTIDFLLSGSFASVIARDWNNDLKEDIIISGINGFVDRNPNIETIFYTRDQNNDFVRSSPITGGVYLSALELFDIDNDMDLDLIISGNNGDFPYQRTDLYINENNSFILSDISLEPLQNTSIDIGDYNSDGYLDVILTGFNEFLRDTTLLYKNVEGVLTGVENSGLNGHVGRSGSVQWGDYDNDPKLFIYRNELATPNTPPSIPSNLTTNSFDINNVYISWESSSDNETNSNALTYNLHVEDTESNIVFSSYANLESGYLKRVWDGNMGLSNTWQFSGLENGQYYTYVQSIDAGYKTSPFSNPSTFYIGLPNAPQSLSLNDIDNIQLTWEDVSNNEEFFIIERKLGEDGIFIMFDSVATNTTTLIDSTLPPSFSVEYQIQASNPNGVSDYSSIASSTINGTPTELSITMSSNGILLSWNDNAVTEEYFIIERKIAGSDSFEKIDSVGSNTTEFIDTDDLEDEVMYRVYTKNEFGISDFSDEASIVILGTDSDYSNKLRVYPNPFNNFFIINTSAFNIKDSQIQIFDLEGKSVQFITEKINESSLRINVISDSHIYFVTVKNKTEVLSFKILGR